MIALLIVIALAAVAAVAGTIHVAATDGYRRVPIHS